MDIPQWFSNVSIQEPNSGYSNKFAFTMPATVSTNYSGLILWLNVGCRTPSLRLSDFWALVTVVSSNRFNSWFCETSLWKQVSQSWVTFIPQIQFPLYANERVSVRVGKGPLESIRAHLVYI